MAATPAIAPKTGAAVAAAAAAPEDLATSFLVSVLVDIFFIVEAETVLVEKTVIFPEEDFEEEVTVLVEIMPDEVTVFPAFVVVNNGMVIVL